MLTKSHKDNSHSANGKALIVAVLLPVYLEAVVLGSISFAVIDKILYLSKKQREYKLLPVYLEAAYIRTVFYLSKGSCQ